ncbi:hypothetical protein C4A75_19775 [Brevibacillus laterosporus]|nr:hypothetical protein C4A75_19775 [Brevibacillus laterosporus]
MVDLTENTGGQGSAPITFLPILAQIQAVLIMILGALFHGAAMLLNVQSVDFAFLSMPLIGLFRRKGW